MAGKSFNSEKEVVPDLHSEKMDKLPSHADSSVLPQHAPYIPKWLQDAFLIALCPLFCFILFVVLPVVLMLTSKDPKPHGPPLIDICNLSSVPYPDVGKMTLEEKVGQMAMVADGRVGWGGWDASVWNLGAVVYGPSFTIEMDRQKATAWLPHIRNIQQTVSDTRLKIPMLYGIDSVHGHNSVYGATIFPHNIGLGATRDPNVVRDVAAATAREMVATGVRWTFAPCLAVCLDPRWGRCYESFGEDPALVSMMNSAVDGLQNGTRKATTNVAATVKHWVADGGTKNGVNTGNAEMSFEELERIHIYPYREAIARNVQFVMASFSSVNGTRMHIHKYLLTDILKGKLGFKGVIVSDWQAVDPSWGMGGDYDHCIKTAINAGMDLIMVPFDYKRFIRTLRRHVLRGLVPMSRIDDAVSRILEAKRFLGLFNQTCAPAATEEAVLSKIGTAKNREIARRAVRKSLVLLKSEPGLFPLRIAGAKILVAGSHADDMGLQSGGWTITWQGLTGPIVPGTTILQGIRNATQALGDKQTVVEYVSCPTGEESADYGIVVVGEKPYAESKGDDHTLQLSRQATDTINTVCGKMKCIVILISGRPLIVEPVLASANAFIAAWLPGSEGGGVADVLFGQFDFSGTSPMSWPRTIEQLPLNVNDSSYDPLFRYGFGLNKAGKVL